MSPDEIYRLFFGSEIDPAHARAFAAYNTNRESVMLRYQIPPLKKKKKEMKEQCHLHLHYIII